MGKVITFRGLERCDVVYFFSKTLALNNNTVILIDNSYTKDMFEAVNQFEDTTCRSVEKGNIVFMRDVMPEYGFYDLFDYVVFYLGETSDIKTIGEHNYIISDYALTSIYRLRRQYGSILERCKIIFRDHVSDKIKESDIAEILEIDKSIIAGAIPYDESDYSNYISLVHNGSHSITSMSNDLREAVSYLLQQATEQDEKAVEAYFKKSRKGKNI